MQHLQTNTTLQGGKYKIEKTLGQGSFGITYLATHTTLDKKVAIKEFFMKELNSRDEDGSITGMTDGSLSANYGQKFKKEAVNLSRLEHPNIVRVTDSFDENGTYYYVMDYIEGENLNDYLKHNSLSHEDAVSIIKDVASALMYMHDKKHMLHLDLKPSNIMRRSSDGHIFLIDFGLSKHYSNDGQPETSTTIGLGTPGYAPIEQSNQNKGGEFRPTIDVYALGATLFKLLTGETPPPASDIVSDDELVEMKLRANGITGSIVDIVVNAMLPNVRKRTQTVKAFVDSLSLVANGNSVSASTQTVNNNEETLVATSPSSRVNNEETVVMGSGVSNHQNFDEASYTIDAKYRIYLTSTRNSAGNGDCDAMLALGMMYLRGDGLSQDFTRAYCLFQDMKRKGDARGDKLIGDWERLKAKYQKDYVVPSSVNSPKVNTTPPQKANGDSGTIGRAWILIVVVIVFTCLYFAIYNLRTSSSSLNYDDCDSVEVETVTAATQNTSNNNNNVSQQKSGVKIAKSSIGPKCSGTINGHDYVDLGLSVKWATMNIGATSVTGYGKHYAWGEIKAKSRYDWSTYKWSVNGSNSSFCKYTDEGAKKTLDLEDDAVKQNWGGAWRMPTHEEQDELVHKCYWVWTSSYDGSGVAGYIVYAAKSSSDKGHVVYNGNTPSSEYSLSDFHLFLPAAGFCDGSSLYRAGVSGFYWSSSLGGHYEGCTFELDSRACSLNFKSGYRSCSHIDNRYYGRSIRAVCP
ncbi:MAG: protein kinase [Bacteroidaceae bacterium]|nr:protein kinase [Bacteroidaceae bacterium]